MGAVRMSIQTADKNIKNNLQVIHTTPVHQWTYCEVKSCVCNKQMHNLMRHFQFKYKPIIHNNTSSSVVLSHQKYNIFL